MRKWDLLDDGQSYGTARAEMVDGVVRYRYELRHDVVTGAKLGPLKIWFLERLWVSAGTMSLFKTTEEVVIGEPDDPPFEEANRWIARDAVKEM